jgi:transposase InsO family protein
LDKRREAKRIDEVLRVMSLKVFTNQGSPSLADMRTFYNRSRRHSALLGKTPASAFEAWVLKQQGKMAA